MIRLYTAIICLVFPVFFSCAWFDAGMKIKSTSLELPCGHKTEQCILLKKLIGPCEGKDFETTQKVRDNYNVGRTAYVVSNWKDFLQCQNDLFRAPFFEKEITKEFFEDNSLGVVFAVTAGSVYHKNEKVSIRDGKCIFSYETWSEKAEGPVPACIWESLYVFKLKKDF
ncbi:MAG: hypothetical protein ABIK92_02740 [Pseudomonadota bacterium]